MVSHASMPADARDNQELIAAAAAGEDAALDELLRRHLPALRAYVRAQLPPALRAKESTSDLVQTTCRAAIRDLDQFSWRGEGSFRLWLSRIALNRIRAKQKHHLAQARDVRREASPGAEAGDYESIAALYRSGGSPSQFAMARELVEQMEAALQELPESYRETWLLHHVVGLSTAEIAQSQERSENAVRVTLSRALARIGTLLHRDQA